MLVIPVPDGMEAHESPTVARQGSRPCSGPLAIDSRCQSEFGSLIRFARDAQFASEVSAPVRGDARWPPPDPEGLVEIEPLSDVRDAFAGLQPLIELTLRRMLSRAGAHHASCHQRPQGGLGGVRGQRTP